MAQRHLDFQPRRHCRLQRTQHWVRWRWPPAAIQSQHNLSGMEWGLREKMEELPEKQMSSFLSKKWPREEHEWQNLKEKSMSTLSAEEKVRRTLKVCQGQCYYDPVMGTALFFLWNPWQAGVSESYCAKSQSLSEGFLVGYLHNKISASTHGILGQSRSVWLVSQSTVTSKTQNRRRKIITKNQTAQVI